MDEDEWEQAEEIKPIDTSSDDHFVQEKVAPAAPTAESAKSFKVPDGAPAVRIMKRPQTPDSARPPDPKPKPPAPQKSLQEREEEYRKARERIFGLDPQSKAREPPTK